MSLTSTLSPKVRDEECNSISEFSLTSSEVSARFFSLSTCDLFEISVEFDDFELKVELCKGGKLRSIPASNDLRSDIESTALLEANAKRLWSGRGFAFTGMSSIFLG